MPYNYRARSRLGETLQETRNTLLGALAVVAAASTWGTLGIFSKILYAEGVSFESLVAFRAAVGWLAVMAFLLATGGLRSLKVARRDLAFLIPLGFIGIGLFYLFYFFTVRESAVGTAAVLLYSSPAFVVVLAWLFLREGLGPAKLVSLGMTVCGVFLVAGAYDPSNLEVTPTVLVTGLLAGLTYGLYSIFGRPVAGRLGPAVILSYALFFGSALLVPAAVPTLHTLAGLSLASYGLLFMLAVVHTTLAFALYTFGLGRLGAGRAAIVATVEPVVAGVLGAVLLGEELTAPKVVGAGLVIAGAVLAQLRLGKTGRTGKTV
ncbi:EamA family transporter [Rubrobacter tropicus]|uniref:EamA family transporter n=1 Tax=Rubrobacter tropicus TaxID=2653851 RepID=A0A6G8Q450_9ACTN|nr:DMT family transporter [Rubrobacter tropicus]QIN81209.1 EamA family transporter [Rubrobacter tropicus]